MSPLEWALAYATRLKWPVFPRPDMGWRGNGWHDASLDPAQITKWWKRWPRALIAMPTGFVSGVVICDIDVKRGRDGFADWARLDPAYSLMPSPIVLTPSGGWHIYLRQPDFKIISSIGIIAPGIDVLSDGMSVPLPTPGFPYRWDRRNTLAACPLKDCPRWLCAPPPPPRKALKPKITVRGLSPYADAVLANACEEIRRAPDGQQHFTLRRKAFRIGGFCGAGEMPVEIARKALIAAALDMPDYDKHRKWTAKRLSKTVDDCFAAGFDRPRGKNR